TPWARTRGASCPIGSATKGCWRRWIPTTSARPRCGSSSSRKR
ncbi:uncharacterized protein METZ01_LOCUS220448, partial [marine metagenome]